MLADDTVRAAEASIRAGSKSFAAAARLFDGPTREGAVMLYGWCRHCDDVVDGQEAGFASARAPADDPRQRLARLVADTEAALSGGSVHHPAFAGLRETVRRHRIPHELPLRHLAGFTMDIDGRRYDSVADLLDYAYHVAGVVGVMMAHVMGVRDRQILDHASDLGLAFQLTNIARDVVEDAACGRLYLPGDWLASAGLARSCEAVGDRRNRGRVAAVAARLVEEAEPYYRSALVGIRSLPPRSAWAIATARGVYRAIGLEVVRRGPRAWDERVSTSRAAKLRHVGAGALLASASRVPRPAPSRRPPDLYARPS